METEGERRQVRCLTLYTSNWESHSSNTGWSSFRCRELLYTLFQNSEALPILKQRYAYFTDSGCLSASGSNHFQEKKRKGIQAQSSTRGMGGWGAHQQYLLHLRPYVQLWKRQEQFSARTWFYPRPLGYWAAKRRVKNAKHIRMKLGAIYF